MLEAPDEMAKKWNPGQLVLERLDTNTRRRSPRAAFEADLVSTGEVVRVPVEQIVVEALEERGITVATSYLEAVSGTCETHV